MSEIRPFRTSTDPVTISSSSTMRAFLKIVSLVISCSPFFPLASERLDFFKEERRAALGLYEEGKVPQRKRLADKLLKALSQNCAHVLLCFDRHFAGQRHVEAEIVEHVRVAPGFEIVPLA